MYCQIINNTISYIFDFIPNRITLDSGYTRTSLYELPIKEQESLGLYYFEDIKPDYDTKTQYLSDPIYMFTDNKVTVQYEIINKSSDQLEREEFLNKQSEIINIKKNRDNKIAKGYVFKGHTFYIDKDSQGDILVAMLRAEKDPTFTTYWKTIEGWIFLSNIEIQQMAMEVMAYVESLFTEERNLVEKIDPSLIRTEPIIKDDVEKIITKR